MKLTSKLAILAGGLVYGLALSTVAWANGEEFFMASGKTGLYYFGHIKDTTGKVLDNVVITIKVRDADSTMSFPVRNDAPGHFRSPDIGNAVKGLGMELDPSQIEIVATKAGYRQVQPTKPAAPGKIAGAVQVEFVMAPAGAVKAK